MACLEPAFYEEHNPQSQLSLSDGVCLDEELLQLYVSCVDADRCQRTQRLLADDVEMDWFGVQLQGVGRVMTFLQSELPVTHHQYSRAERVPHICRRVRKRASLSGCDDDPTLTANLLALSLVPPPAGSHSRHSSISAESDSTFSLCSSYDGQGEEPAGPMTLLRVSGSLAFDGPWADRDTLEDGSQSATPPEGKWRRKMRLSIAYTCLPLKIHKLYYEENTKARRSLNFS